MDERAQSRHLTPTEVLYLLRHFAQVSSDEPFVSPGADQITMGTSIDEFDVRRDTDGDLASNLNIFFFVGYNFQVKTPSRNQLISENDRELEQLIRNGRSRPLEDLCLFLSDRLTLTPRPAFGFLDRPCQAGAIFLALKARLAAFGFDVSCLCPSTPLKRFSHWYSWPLAREAAFIAPDKVPLLEPGTGAYFLGLGKCLGCLVFMLSLLFLACGLKFIFGWLWSILMPLAFILNVLGLIFPIWEGFNRFPGLSTFRDLCKAMAGEPITRPQRI